MSLEFDIDIECPNCSKEFSVSTTKVGSKVSCPHCHEIIELKDNSLTAGLSSAEKQIDDLLNGF